MTSLAMFVLACVALAIGALITHELGHVFAGMLCGFRLDAFYFGPLALDRRKGKMCVSWQRCLALYPGAVQVNPAHLNNLKERSICVHLGGPAASFLAALVSFGGAQLLAPDTNTRLLLENFGIFNALIVLGTLAPLLGAGLPTDGLTTWRLFRGGEAAARLLARSIAIPLLQSGSGPQDWSASWSDRIVAYVDEYGEIVSEPLIAYATFLIESERGNEKNAQRALDGAMINRHEARPVAAEILACRALMLLMAGDLEEANRSLERAWIAERRRTGKSLPTVDHDRALAVALCALRPSDRGSERDSFTGIATFLHRYVSTEERSEAWRTS